jgi:hypothetical protein
MAYSGIGPNFGNLASQAASSVGGTSITLDYTVGSAESVLFILGGVVQAPNTDFTVSGTTMTLSTTSSGVPYVIYFLGLKIDIGVPADATITAAKLASNAVTTAKIIANAVDETKLKDALVADFTEVVVAAGDSFLLGDSSDSGNTKRDTVQGLLDLVPAAVNNVKFLVMPSGSPANVTGAGTNYTLIFDTEVFDTGDDFDGTSTFTAPETGKYLLTFQVVFSGVTAAADAYSLTIVTSNRTFLSSWNLAGDFSTQPVQNYTALADMDTGDTAVCKVSGGGESSNVWDVAGGGLHTHFSGVLLA